jgi:hypothetical protein
VATKTAPTAAATLSTTPAEEGPALIDTLHHEIGVAIKIDLAGKLEQMGGARHQNESTDCQCQEFKGRHPSLAGHFDVFVK